MKKNLNKISTLFLLPLFVGLLVLLWPSTHNNTLPNRIASSELMTQDEVIYGLPMGISGHVPQLSPDSTWANYCAFITASCLNGGTTLSYASAYYHDPRCSYPANSPKRFSGSVHYSDLEGWWGQETFSPFTSYTLPDNTDVNNFVYDLANFMATESTGIICEEVRGDNTEGHVWALLSITLDMDQPTKCGYTAINSEINPTQIIETSVLKGVFVELFVDTQYCYLGR